MDDAKTQAKAKTPADDARKSGKSPKTPRKLYANVALLHSGAHGKLKLGETRNHAFAAGLNSSVLAAAEFPQAAAHYPIVFSRNDGAWAAFAVLGPRDGENAFVDSDGNWAESHYIPAFIRRYPFVLVEDAEKQNFSLAADMDSDILSEKAGEALYDEDGKPTTAAQNVLNFCLGFHNQLKQTGELVARMADSGILVSRNAEVTLADKSRSRLTGFHVVDEPVLAELDDASFLALRKDGVLNLIYSHLWSMRSWNNILA